MIMVTGATGFLGAHVLYELVSKGFRVRALYRDPQRKEIVRRIFAYYTDDIRPLWENIEWNEGDILDYYSLLENMQGITEMYHTAGMVSFNDHDKTRLDQINTKGAAHIVNACLETGVNKLCFVSSIATLGESDDPVPIDEDMRWNPGNAASAYAISKLNGEMEVWRGIHEGLQAVIVNPSVIIGPGMWLGPARQLLEQIRLGLRYYPVGSTGYVDVRDVARAMTLLKAGNHMNERYIVSAENITHRFFLDQVADALGKPRPDHPITPVLMKVASMAESLRSVITGKEPRLTRKALEMAAEKLNYSNRKIIQALSIRFIPVEESVRFSIPLFIAETSSLKV